MYHQDALDLPIDRNGYVSFWIALDHVTREIRLVVVRISELRNRVRLVATGDQWRFLSTIGANLRQSHVGDQGVADALTADCVSQAAALLDVRIHTLTGTTPT